MNISVPRFSKPLSGDGGPSPYQQTPGVAAVRGIQKGREEAQARAQKKGSLAAGLKWWDWARTYAPNLLSAEPAPHHVAAWEWEESLEPGETSDTLILAWNRGAAKSATFQGFCIRWAFTLKRRFVLVVCETQDQAEKFVASVAEALEANGVQPARNPLGISRGWRKNMIRTAEGFNLMGVGWEVATRGIRLGEMRPDVLLFDDVDGRLDTPAMTLKKKTVLTQTFIPAGAPDLAVAFGQNVILAGGLMDQLVKGTADFLTDCVVSFVKAVDDLVIEYQEKKDGRRVPFIASGTPSWPQRLPIAALDKFLAKMGAPAFLREYQHDIDEASGGLWDGTPIRYVDDVDEATGCPRFTMPVGANGLPIFEEIVVAVDPSGSDRGDEAGIVAAGLFRLPDGEKAAIVLEDLSGQMSPKMWAQESIALYRRLGGRKLLCERNFGGQLVEDNLKDFPGAPPVTMVSVSSGKQIRAQPVLQRYESGLVWHAHRHPNLEAQMNGWRPSSGMPSPGALDAMVICLSVIFGIADYVKAAKPTSSIPAHSRIGSMTLHGYGAAASMSSGDDDPDPGSLNR